MPPTININDERYKRLRFHMRRLRLAADLTQVQLAQRLHVDQPNVSKIERGERYVDVLFYLDWCRACGIDPGTAFSKLASLDNQ